MNSDYVHRSIAFTTPTRGGFLFTLTLPMLAVIAHVRLCTWSMAEETLDSLRDTIKPYQRIHFFLGWF